MPHRRLYLKLIFTPRDSGTTVTVTHSGLPALKPPSTALAGPISWSG